MRYDDAGRFVLCRSEETGQLVWKGYGGPDDKDGTELDALYLKTDVWPIGTVVTAITPHPESGER